MSWSFRVFDDASAYAEYVRPFLLASEAENNVLLGILTQLQTGDHEFGSPILLGAVERDQAVEEGQTTMSSPASRGARPDGDHGEEGRRPGSTVVGCVWRTPPFKLGLTAMPAAAAEAVAAGVSDVCPLWLEAAFGPVDAVLRFAEAWSRRAGARYRLGMRQGIYQLNEVTPPARMAPGEMVAARMEDLPMVIEWGIRFRRDSHAQAGDPEALGRRLVESGRMYLWRDEGAPRSMAAAVAFTDNGVRVGYVYTPPEDRGRGYASGLVADLSQEMLDEGRDFCFLYADLANPTATGIYTRIGYRKVLEALDVTFDRAD